MSKKFRLSKSQYCKSRKCQKALWLYRHNKAVADPVTPMQQNIFDQGTSVGELATNYFEGGVLIVEDYTQSEQALITTQEILKQNPPAIFEAAFMFDDILIRVDVLKNNFDGTWDLIEVKSTNDVKPKAHYDDVAVQKYILKNCGFVIRQSCLMHLNREYFKKGELDYKKLFVIQPLDIEIDHLMDSVADNIELARANLALENEPYEIIGSKCNSPYVCEFKGHCFKQAGAVEGSIHKIGRINDKKRHALMDMSVTMASESPEDFKWSTNQQIEVEAYKNNEVHIELGAIQDYLGELKYPLYYLDYESVAYAAPRFDDTKPHQHLISQYSLHIQEKPGGPLVHKEYLHNENTNPSKSVAEQLIKDIPDDGGSVIVYYKPYEKSRTKELAEMLPEVSSEMNSLIDRMWDLHTPFSKHWYWDKEFHGSSSIKKVLPVFAPEFSYKDLQIQGGGVAQMEYANMIELPIGSTERGSLREALLKYCERDTYAMVVILEKLFEILKYQHVKSV